MLDSIREFVIGALRDMNYDVSAIGNDTDLGPAGVDVESVALVELAIRVEDKYGVTFGEDEAEELAVLTVGEFCALVAGRLSLARAQGDSG